MNCFAFIFVGMQQNWPPAYLQPEELPEIARAIARIWKEVALRTRKLNEDDITDINISRPGENERSKALTMLMRYKEGGGTRAMLAKAIKEDKEPLSEKVLQGSFIDGHDMDTN